MTLDDSILAFRLRVMRRAEELGKATAACRELVCLDTFSFGKLKGTGKVRQITACDAACSYGVAWLLPALSAEVAAAFVQQIVVPLYQRALDIRHTQPRHAWTNGFVERLQGTILHEHWRIEFRRRYFTGRAAPQPFYVDQGNRKAPQVGEVQ